MYYFIVNEAGGSGAVREGFRRLRPVLNAQQIDYRAYRTASRRDAARIVRHICGKTDADKRVVVVGGDGTVNEVLNGITDFDDVALGVIPLGSGNDFANALHLPKDPLRAWERIVFCKLPRRVDLGRVTYASGKTRLFGISAGIGLDAIVCRAVMTSRLKPVLNRFGLGRLVYPLLTLRALVTMRQLPVSVSLDGRRPLIIERTVFVAAMNMPIEGGGVRMAPQAVPDDGRLTVCCGHSAGRLLAPWIFASLLRGKHTKRREFFIHDFRKMKLHCLEPMTLHTDGEHGGEVRELEIETLPGRLRLLG